jgi:hypothetical protein
MDGPALYGALRASHPALLGRIAFITGDTLSTQIKSSWPPPACPASKNPSRPRPSCTLVARLS